MAKRRHTGPPLYDLITTHSRSRSTAPREQAVERREPLDEDGAAPLGWVNPGRKVAFPVGYVFVAIAIALAVCIVAYVIGHTRGEDLAEASIDESLRDAWQAEDEARRTDDPLLAARVGRYDQSGQSQPQPGTVESTRPNQPAKQPPRSASTRSGAGSSGPIVHDPRVKGENYFVLATTRREGAIRLAEFCRARGLDAYVVGGHNARFSQVIALPAVESASMSDPRTRALQESILRIGREWERSEPGATDLSDAYVQLYR